MRLQTIVRPDVRTYVLRYLSCWHLVSYLYLSLSLFDSASRSFLTKRRLRVHVCTYMRACILFASTRKRVLELRSCVVILRQRRCNRYSKRYNIHKMCNQVRRPRKSLLFFALTLIPLRVRSRLPMTLRRLNDVVDDRV